MGDLKVGEGFIDAVMIRVTATGAAALGLAPTCTLTRLSTGARVGLTVAEVSDGIYKVTDMAPGNDDEWMTEWAVGGANTIYQAYKLFKVGGGVIADWEDGGRLDLLIDGIIADIGVFPSANYATIAAYVEDIRARLIVILADVTGLAGAAMRGTDGAALVADGWDAALATILDNFSALRIGYLDQLDFALQEAIAALQTDLDNPNQYKADLTTLETRLSAARAGYLDQLDFNLQEAIAAIQADIGVFPTANYATLADYVEDIRTRLIAIVADTGAIAWGDITGIVNDIGVFPTANYATLAAYVEDIRTRLIAIVADTGAIVWGDVTTIKGLVDSAEAVGPFSYLDAGGEQDVYEDAVTTRRRIWIEVSNRNMTLAGTFIIYRKVDGANYDVWTTQPTTVGAGDDRVFDAEFTTNQHWKITYEESADEGAARAIPYNVITQVIE